MLSCSFRKTRLSPGSPSKQATHVQSFPVQSWTLTFNMQTKAWAWDVAHWVFAFFEHWTVWPCWEFAGASTPGKIDDRHVLSDMNVFHLWIIVLTEEWWTLNCLEMVFESSQTDIFPFWHYVNTQPNAPDQQTAKMFALISNTWLLLTLWIPMETVGACLVFHTLRLYFSFC